MPNGVALTTPDRSRHQPDPDSCTPDCTAADHVMTYDQLPEVFDRMLGGSDPLAAAWEALDAELGERIAGMDTVSVVWAPAHTAPYVSQLILAPIIGAVLSRHRPLIEAAVRAAHPGIFAGPMRDPVEADYSWLNEPDEPSA